jgi:DNA-binding MarR family transcriptional regulator
VAAINRKFRRVQGQWIAAGKLDCVQFDFVQLNLKQSIMLGHRMSMRRLPERLFDGGVSLRLEHQLCFLLYSSGRALTQLYQPILAPLGVTYPQYLVLLVLWQDAPAAVSVGTLGARLQLDSGTLTPLVKRMEAAGLLLRARSASDGRVVEVRLTPAGRALERRARAVPRALACQLNLSPHTITTLRHTLKRLLAATQMAQHTQPKRSTPSIRIRQSTPLTKEKTR